jgi:hypothetical protein
LSGDSTFSSTDPSAWQLLAAYWDTGDCNTGYDKLVISITDRAAQERLDTILPALAASAGATETLKAIDSMKWVGIMNTCKAQVEEIIFEELIYVD